MSKKGMKFKGNVAICRIALKVDIISIAKILYQHFINNFDPIISIQPEIYYCYSMD